MKKLLKILFIALPLFAFFSCEEDVVEEGLDWTVWMTEDSGEGYKESHILTFQRVSFTHRIVGEYDRDGSGTFLRENEKYISGSFLIEPSRVVLRSNPDEYVSLAWTFINVTIDGDILTYPQSDGKNLIFKKVATIPIKQTF